MHVLINFDQLINVDCSNIESAKVLFESVRDDGNYGEGYGASDMGARCGEVYEGDKLVARIHYNGRIESVEA